MTNPWGEGPQAEQKVVDEWNELANRIYNDIDKIYPWPDYSEQAIFNLVRSGCVLLANAFSRVGITKCTDAELDMIRNVTDTILGAVNKDLL